MIDSKNMKDSHKTCEWLSATQIARRTVNGIAMMPVIMQKLQELQHSMPDYIMFRQLTHGAAVLSLHVDVLPLFIEQAGLQLRSDVPHKTPDWLNVTELTKYYVGRFNPITPVLTAGLTKLQSQMPDKIALRQSVNKRVVLCLHVSALGEFGQRMNLELKDSVPEKTPQWLCVNDLVGCFVGDMQALYPLVGKKLKDLQHSRPDIVQVRKSRAGRSILCLHTDGFDMFANMVGCVRRDQVCKKTPDWLSVTDISKYYKGSQWPILLSMKGLQSQMPDKIQSMRSSTGNCVLCLHISALDEFARINCLRPRTPNTAPADVQSAQDGLEEIKQMQDSMKISRQR